VPLCTGQHAVHFAAALPHLVWQTSDLPAQLPGIRQWLAHAALPNTPPPCPLDVRDGLPAQQFDAVFTANTLHIMGWPEVQALFAQLPAVMAPGALLTVYGPFNRDGRFTSESNAQFDVALRAADPCRGLRDLAAVGDLAARAGLLLREERAMPAHNLCLTWQRPVPD
jgi:hypothetical protein